MAVSHLRLRSKEGGGDVGGGSGSSSSKKQNETLSRKSSALADAMCSSPDQKEERL